MTAEQYQRWTAPLRSHPKLTRLLLLANQLVTYAIYFCYPLLILFLLWQEDSRLWKAVLVPGIGFVLLSVFRDRFNAPRPYECLQIQPLIQKDTKGHSFPSRHVFSASVIGMTFLWIVPPLGIIILCCAVLLAVLRVLGGVHFPKDVLCGFVIGILTGLIGLYLI